MFYDTHAHLDYPEFAQDFPDLLKRAEAAGVTKIITIGTDLESSARAIRLAEMHPQIYAAVGWHPSNVLAAPLDIRAPLKALAMHPKAVAIGEAGLDYYRLPSQSGDKTAEDDAIYKSRQQALFTQQLEVAAELGLNCVVHQRASFDDTLRILEPFSSRVRGVFHCFVESVQAMDRVLSLGSLVSFTGIITFKSAESVRATVAATPMGSFMTETDCPYLAPMPYRGKRCEPAYVREIAERICEVKRCTLQELSEATCRTAGMFFPKMREDS